MSWRVIASSEIGTSHIKTQTRCADENWTTVDRLPSGEDLLAIIVSDGAGSAIRGWEGAEAAVEAIARELDKREQDPHFELSAELAVELAVAARTCIDIRSSNAGLEPRDFACTLIGVCSTPRMGTLAFQIGDGAIVLDVGAGLELAIEPMGGEYANMTRFVTEEAFLGQLAVKLYPSPVRRIAAFTDGLQHLALDLANGTPHEPFFRPFFDALAGLQTDDEDHLLEQLSGALKRFLSGSMVNERTDDDKTLALAVWMDERDGQPTALHDPLESAESDTDRA